MWYTPHHMPKLQAFRESDPGICEKYVSWALDNFRDLCRGDFNDLESATRALRRWRRSQRGFATHDQESKRWIAATESVVAMTTESIRDALLRLNHGVMSDVNGVPVRRVACSGTWFEVCICQVDAFFRPMQMLRLTDAISRCKSASYPTLKPRFSPAEARSSLEQLGVDQGWTTYYEDTPEWHRQQALSYARNVDGEHPAWKEVRTRWLGSSHEHDPPSEPQISMLDEWLKIDPDAVAYPRLTTEIAAAWAAKHPEATTRTPAASVKPRRRHSSATQQLDLWST